MLAFLIFNLAKMISNPNLKEDFELWFYASLAAHGRKSHKKSDYFILRQLQNCLKKIV